MNQTYYVVFVIALIFFTIIESEAKTGGDSLAKQYTQQSTQMRKDPNAYLQNNKSNQTQALLPQILQGVITAEAHIALQNNNAALYALDNATLLTNQHGNELEQTSLGMLFELISDGYLNALAYAPAHKAISRAIDLTSNTEDSSRLLSRLQKRAAISAQSGSSISALQDLQLGLELANKQGDIKYVSALSTAIARVHQQRNEHSLALEYAERGITHAKSHAKYSADKNQLLLALKTSIPSLIETQQILLATKRVSEMNSLINHDETSSDRVLALFFNAQIAFANQDYETAIESSMNSLSKNINIEEEMLAKNHLLLSRAYTRLNNIDQAIEHLVSAVNAVNFNNSQFELVQAIHMHRADLLAQLGQYEEAYRVATSLITARNIQRPINDVKRMLDMHENFQLQLEQQENSLLRAAYTNQSAEIQDKQMLNRLYFLIIVLLFFISCLLMFVFLKGRLHREKLEAIAHKDELTGLYSRRKIMEILTYEQDMFNRSQLNYCVAIIDLDFFKQINDQYGHQRGDEVLQDAASIAQTSFRKTDSLGRIGGEEFLFIFPNTGLREGQQLLNKYRESLKQISENRNLKSLVTASIGLVEPLLTEAPKHIISRADKALYRAKNNGRNCIIVDESDTM